MKIRTAEHTFGMGKLQTAYRYVRKKYALLTTKKYTTIAGTLVFFLSMSIVPFGFWLTLLIGRLPIDTEKLLSLSVFASVKEALLFVRKEATNATVGASVLLLCTTLYSATNLFYQMRRSGEIIYEYRGEKTGLRLRLGALLLLLIVMASLVAFLALFAVGCLLVSALFSEGWAQLAEYALLAAVAFLLSLLLNAYVCPYKARFRELRVGALLTVAFWILAVSGFSVYLRWSNLRRLYGALSTLVVFFLWLYLMMIGFVVGVIFNSEKILAKRVRKGTRAKKRRT